MRVAILGCGPAGLMAAQAFLPMVDAGVAEVDIYSIKRKSPLYGSQYLHRPIPGVTTSEPRSIEYVLRGTPDAYRRKVYGQMWDGSVSPQDYGGLSQAWDIRQTYDNLWKVWEPAIIDGQVDAGFIAQALNAYQIVINSIPRPALCWQGHQFASQTVIAAGDAPELGIDVGSTFRCNDETVICNGNEYPSWYRLSRIFGHTTVEWPEMQRMVPVSTAARVQKPLSHNCDCWKVMWHVGRYGTWTKGVLSHDAYFQTLDRIQNHPNVNHHF